VTGFLILGQTACLDTVERDDHSRHTSSNAPNLNLLSWVCSGKVALPGGMLVVGSIVAVATHFVGSSATVVAPSECWVYASEATTVASIIEDAAFQLAPMIGSSVVA
jgi:hypothetical protein